MEPVSFSPQSDSPTTASPMPEMGIGDDHIDFKPLYERYQAAPNPRTDRIFEEIWNWAKSQAPEKDKDSILWEVSKLSNRLGSAGVGEKPWVKVIAYVSTYNQLRSAEERLKQMEQR
jgi:hypothetical protein